ncbi:MAG: hypothetical protein ACLFTL_05850 [Alphaproteobacteria bacterium]
MGDLGRARRLVNARTPPRLQYRWPPLAEAAVGEVWVKHENHPPSGALELRGRLVSMAELRAARLGAHAEDFDAARTHAVALAERKGPHRAPSRRPGGCAAW